MTFLQKIIAELHSQTNDLSKFNIILPGKRPVVFIRKILAERGYSGMLPNFYTIEDLITQIADRQEVKGIALWLFAYEVYAGLFPSESFSDFLKWFPTLLKDWDDILKFSESDTKVLEYMLAEERIKNWGETIGEDEESARRRNLNFWKKMNVYLPELKRRLAEKNWATPGMIHELSKNKVTQFAQETEEDFVFCGFNAFTPVEETLVRELLQWDKAQCFFQADRYYMEDTRQEAGEFLRKHRTWKEFNDSRPFGWIASDFEKDKKIRVFDVSGNITQTKILPEIFESLGDEGQNNTAVVLLDENLLPASLDALSSVDKINITMGFPLKNLSFSIAIKQLFHIQKQLEKKASSYYYKDVLAVLQAVPHHSVDEAVASEFNKTVQERNMVYLSADRLREHLGKISYFHLFLKAQSVEEYLNQLIDFCFKLKFKDLDDIQFENVAHFEKSFKIIKNQLSNYHFEIKMETLEVLIHQLVSTETIDFEGEPLQGLQIMGLLETRLLNFKNIILLSVNEGKLPLGNTQNTYLPFDVRKNFGMHTFLQNDSIYAYHFYRLIQDSENVFLLYNALTSGMNTGEKSRFITQLLMESPHKIEVIVIENSSEPIDSKPVKIEKTPVVLDLLEEWKQRISATHLTSYLYDPAKFYFTYILKTRETDDVEEELSQRNYGNLIHYSLQFLYEKVKGKTLKVSDLQALLSAKDEAINFAIEKLKHQPEFYSRGMNYVHKSIAGRIVEAIIQYDMDVVKKGHTLEILDLEMKFENVLFYADEEKKISVQFHGYIDRLDKLDGKIRVIDYKTAKSKDLTLKVKRGEEQFHITENYKQALQLCIYLYFLRNTDEFKTHDFIAGIWSFAEVNSGVQPLNLDFVDLEQAMSAVGNLILEILDPEIPFEEKERVFFGL